MTISASNQDAPVELGDQLWTVCPLCGKAPTEADKVTPGIAVCSEGEACRGICYRLCVAGCGEGSPEGHHFFHGDMVCAWHDGACEEAEADPELWCGCDAKEAA